MPVLWSGSGQAMKSDDDVAKLFSWLQTPEIHYREFADAREIADIVPGGPRPKAAETPSPPQEPHRVEEAEPGHDESPRSEPAPPPSPQRAEPLPEAAAGSPPTPADSTEQTRRPLDSVFNRLSGARASDRDTTSRRPR